MRWSITRKMIAMGLGVFLALAVLEGISLMNSKVIKNAVDSNNKKGHQLQIAQDMKTEQVKLVLNGMKAVDEKDTGNIDDRLIESMESSSVLLKSRLEDLKETADTNEQRTALDDIGVNLNNLSVTIREDLVTLIKDSAARNAQIDQSFKDMHVKLDDLSKQIETNLETIGASLQFKINMADSQEEADKARQGSELINYAGKAVTHLVLTAVESIVEKDLGVITEDRMKVIQRNIKFLEEGLPDLVNYADEGEEQETVKKIQSMVKDLANTITEDLAGLIPSATAETARIEESFDEMDAKLNDYVVRVNEKLDGISEYLRKDVASATEHLLKTQNSASRNGLIIALITALVVGIAFYFFSKGITGPVNRIISDLTGGADQVADSSAQVSNASFSLSEGASEQAAAIEETSSSLEEMSSMTKQNADSANQSNAIVKDTNNVVKKAGASMNGLMESMGEISKASEETQKIVKTIDEIAFQTNLLALNAAVEAARAGEAGAGFSVVADEVRNLAMRAADAAGDTTNLIEETIKKVHIGSNLVSETNDAFSEVAQSVQKLDVLIDDIAAASNEQADGIGQITRAVSEMDILTQKNASNAEESASAAESMRSQAEMMKTVVMDLVALVRGSRKLQDQTDAISESPDAVETRAIASQNRRNTAVVPLKQDDFGRDDF